MSTVFTVTAKAVPAHWVLAVMLRYQPSNREGVLETYDETSAAIAEAASRDPLFPGEDGGITTAALLLAVAFERSCFNPKHIGGAGTRFGLFQIDYQDALRVTPVSEREALTANTLMLPRTAAPIAIRILRGAGPHTWKRHFANASRLLGT